MDLPPSGWYPDPYGAPDLLRWWDGLNWTQHTHPVVGAADPAVGGGGSASGGSAVASGATGGAQPAASQPGSDGRAARDRVIGDWAGSDWPTGDQLASTKPPKGPRTEPQPALPDTSVQPSVQPGGGGGGAGGADGTQVLFLGGDAWQLPGGGSGPSGPAGPNLYGYQEAQRRRRWWLIGGLVTGTAVAIAVIVVVATSMNGSPSATAADQTPVTTPPSPTAAAAPSPTATVSATRPASTLSDGQSGLSYSQLASPWSATCPSDLDTAFSWTAGESAIAGQVNGGQTPWYGEACSGPLPAQYNYSDVQDLDNTATNVAQTLQGAYYNALDHSATPVLSQPTSVSGHPGWEVEYQITYTNAAAQGASWTSEYGAVVVADTGTGNTPVVFFSSVPDTLGGQSTASSLVSSLQLTVVPNPSGSGADGSPGPGGSPGD